MSLPQADPSIPSGPAPIFADTDAGRGDHLRLNNQKIWLNLNYLDARIDTEAAARASADSTLQTNLDAKVDNVNSSWAATTVAGSKAATLASFLSLASGGNPATASPTGGPEYVKHGAHINGPAIVTQTVNSPTAHVITLSTARINNEHYKLLGTSTSIAIHSPDYLSPPPAGPLSDVPLGTWFELWIYNGSGVNKTAAFDVDVSWGSGVPSFLIQPGIIMCYSFKPHPFIDYCWIINATGYPAP